MEVVQVRQNATDIMVGIQVLPLDELDLEEIHQGSSLNVVIGNIEDIDWEMAGIMFGPMNAGEQIIVAHPNTNWPRIIAALDSTSTTNQVARERKSRGLPLDIQHGYVNFFVEEPVTFEVCAWKPYR